MKVSSLSYIDNYYGAIIPIRYCESCNLLPQTEKFPIGARLKMAQSVNNAVLSNRCLLCLVACIQLTTVSNDPSVDQSYQRRWRGFPPMDAYLREAMWWSIQIALDE